MSRHKRTPSDLAKQIHTTSDSYKNDLLIIAALIVAALCFRIYSLQFYHVISTDGTSYALNARALANGNLDGIGTSGFYSVLVAGASFLIGDLELSGRVVSILFGSLLIVPLYLLGTSVFSRGIASAASIVAVVWPPFAASSCEVMTQATHTTLQLASICLIWHSFKRPSTVRCVTAGLFMGVTYLTRPESLLLAIAMPLVLSLAKPDIPIDRKRTVFFYFIGFAIPFIANMFLVHHVTGEWQLSAKTDSALNDALSYYLNLPDINYTPGYEPKSYLDILKEHPGFVWQNTAKNLKTLWMTFLPPFLWFLFAVGFSSDGFNHEKNIKRLFFLATASPIAVLLIFYYIDSGYVQAYQPFTLLFAAHGFSVLEGRFKNRIQNSFEWASIIKNTPLLLIAAFIYAAFLTAPQIRTNITDAEYWPRQDDGRRAEKHIGILLKNNLPEGRIMTRWARIAFYADREYVNVPVAYFDKIMSTARENKVRFFIADGYLLGNRPGLGDEIFRPFEDRSIPEGLHFYKPDTPAIKGLRPYLIYKHPRSMGVIVYEIIY